MLRDSHGSPYSSLTEEEKKQKLAELREKMAQKRTAKAAVDAQENKANEMLRRKAGKFASCITITVRR